MEEMMKLNNEMFENLAKSAANVIEYFDGEERQNMLKQLRAEVEKLCTMEEKVKEARQIEESITAAYGSNEITDEERTNLVEEYKTKMAQVAPDPTKNANLREFDKVVSALENDGAGNDGGGEDDDGDLQLTRNTVIVIDPVTKKRMTDPVKNVICGHVYDRTSVEALVNMNAHTRCPVPGCKYKEYLSMKNMKSDIVTKTYLLRHPASNDE